MHRKKRVGFITSYPGAKTGFSRNIKALLPYLFNKDKYELFLLAQGMPAQTPDFARWPWHTEGAFQGEIDNQRINVDEGYRRMISYGNMAVENFVLKHKLDVVFHIEDGWSSDPNFYFKKDWFKHVKQNFVNWTTADSRPILPLFKDWAKNCPNIWFWTSFAEKALKAENDETFRHVRTVHGTLNTSEFKPLSRIEKFELRRKNNIPQDEIIFAFVSRNQLRKLFWANMHALSRFKKLHPEFKAKLLFHTSWSEGWNLPLFIEEFGLDKSDVYTTYVCRACGDFEIKPFVGEDQKCPHCGTNKSQITANVTTGITEEDLNKVYNIADAYLHPMTSGGLEYGLVEAALCGLPLATVPYSCGEDFTENDFVYSIDCNYTREIGTNFVKAVPNINSIIKYMAKICKMDWRERQQLGMKSRDWAVKTFDVSNIGKIVEDFIDGAPLIDWDSYKPGDYKPKNPNYPMQEIEDNVAWLKDMYINILGVDDITDGDSGLQHWMQALAQGLKREDIYKFFIRTAQEEQAKQQGKTQSDFSAQFDSDDKGKRLLLAMPESFGDCFLITSIFKSIKESYPKDWNLYVATKPQYRPVFEGNEHVHKIIDWIPAMDNFFMMEGRAEHEGFVNVYLAPYMLTQRNPAYTHNGYNFGNLETRCT